ncbi:hypothetical protein AVEN_136810-1 [Araneus ventricosus]|uniref:Uncharacterized protein n=1 Tax=Araneus ventricosus TaxID=182803 RepID=A0A4Y2NVW2_ARAVE|nr:hypothetical protein AVEN_136810-1 [Araneus ventricosus]
MIAKKDFLHDEHSQYDACSAQDLGFSRRFSNEDDVTIKTGSPLRRVLRISAVLSYFKTDPTERRAVRYQDVTRNSDSKRRTYILNEKLLFFFLYFSDIFQMHAGSRARTWSGEPIVGHQPITYR